MLYGVRIIRGVQAIQSGAAAIIPATLPKGEQNGGQARRSVTAMVRADTAARVQTLSAVTVHDIPIGDRLQQAEQSAVRIAKEKESLPEETRLNIRLSANQKASHGAAQTVSAE